MNLTRLTNALNQLTQSGPYSTFKFHSYEDDQKADFWYFFLTKTGLQYPGLYLNMHGQISATCLLDPTLKSLDVQALFTLDNKTGDITCHHIGHGKLHLPGIANSSGMKYGIVDVELSVTQFLNHLPTGQCPVTFKVEEVKPWPKIKLYECDCGAHKCGYRDDELHAHARWCELVTRGQTVTHGNGD